MPKLQSAHAYIEALSPARKRLASLHEARAAAQAEAKEAEDRIARLASLATAADPIRGKLAGLDAQEAQRFAAWSRGDSSEPVPAADTAARIDLTRELGEAEARAAAARRAAEGMRHEVDSARRKAAAVEADLRFASGLVALDELAEVAAEATAVMAKLADARMRGRAIAQVLGSVSQEAGPTAPGFAAYNAAYAAAGEALKNSFELPKTDENAERAILASVAKLLVDLRSDSTATLEV